MRLSRILLPLSVLVLIAAPVFSQPIPDGQDRATRQAQINERRIEADLDSRMLQLRTLDARLRAMKEVETTLIPKRDAEAEKVARVVRKIDPELLEKHADFLQQDGTGILRLVPNFDCLADNIVYVNGKCSAFVPGLSDFCFRTKKYAYPLFHDLGLNNGNFVSSSFFAQGILVSLKDIPIDGVTREHKAIKFLADLAPDATIETARETSVRFAAGTMADGYFYRSSLPVAENVTYGLRVIAYRLGNSPPSYDKLQTQDQRKFLYMTGDERRDIVIVFRVVASNENGERTIIWKELRSTDPPKLKFTKGEALEDFKVPAGKK